MGIGLSMIFLGTGHGDLGAIGLAAALLHVLNHSLFKNLLFMTVGSVIHQTHEADLDHLGGLIRRMPKTAAITLLGCIAMAALPPLNGFVSEWLTFQAALHATALESGVLRSMIPVAAAGLAFTGAIAAATCVKFFGIGFLGLPRRHHAARAREVTHLGMLAGPALLGVLCLALGLMPTIVIHALDPVFRLLLGATLPGPASGGWLWLTPGTAVEAAYSAPFAALGLALAWLAVRGFTRGVSIAGSRQGPAWDCGFGGLNARMQYTAVAFSQPIRRIFAPVWELRESLPARDPTALDNPPIAYHLEVADRSWRVLYAPLGHLVEQVSRQVARIHTGNIRIYLTYSFFTLLLLLGIISG
jgi:hydrogenase-4 component B